MSWEEAAALSGSATIADQALFMHGGLETSTNQPKRVLITGASGGVGMYIVKFAVAAGHYIVAATSSTEHNGEFLFSLGAHEVVEYGDLKKLEAVDFVIDSVGHEVLVDCWSIIKPDGTMVSFDAVGWGYVEEHKSKGISKGKEGVRALYFIAEPSKVSMERINQHVLKGNMKGHVLKTVSLDEAREAYESAHSRGLGHGKIVVLP